MVKSLLALAAIGLAVLAPGAASADNPDPVKAAWVYAGPIDEDRWIYQHNQGRLAVEKALGDQVETTYEADVQGAEAAEQVIRQLAAEGNDIIFTTSFGFMKPTIEVAKSFADTDFENAAGNERADNVGTYSARYYEGRYVIGQIAGRMSKNATIGYIASFPTPEVIRGINAFKLGMDTVRPGARLLVLWVNTRFDPDKEADAAKALADQGADIFVQDTYSTGPMQVAEARGLLAFGQASSMIEFGPSAQLTAIVFDWSAYYIGRVQTILDGTWAPDDTWGGFNTGMVKMAPYTNMPDDVAKQAAETEAAIRAGTLLPFAGPIYKQDGELVVGEGDALSDEQLLDMNWYVKGIEDKLPE